MIYEPLVAWGYEWINCCDDSDYEVFASFDGSLRGQSWKPIKVKRVRADKRQPFKRSDFPWLGSHALVMRNSAVEVLHSLLSESGEILPLLTEDGTELFVLNVTRVLDALDVSASEILRFPGTDRIMRIKRAVFLDPVVRDAAIFRLPHRGSSTYVSDRFVKTVRDAGLKGLEFSRLARPEKTLPSR